MIQIFDSEDPRVAEYRSLKTNLSRNSFISDHEKLVVRHLESNLYVNSIYTTKKYLDKYSKLIGSRVEPDKIYLAEEEVMEKTIGFSLHQGCMSSGRIPDWKTPEELSGNLIYCSGIVDPENMGSILRTGASMGINSYLLSSDCISPYHRRSVRVSMGNLFHQSFARGSFYDFVRFYREIGYTWIALSLPRPGKKSENLYTFPFPKKFILVLGNESDGVREEILREMDFLLSIPMEEGVDSLNVSHSLAVALAFWKGQINSI